VTASNTTDGEPAWATRVATRRNADCSSTIRRSSARASALAMATATSSVKSAIRRSVPDGSGSVLLATIIAPQRRPSTTIGLPTEERMPTRRALSPAGSSVSS
jgi:hypothetical protein